MTNNRDSFLQDTAIKVANTNLISPRSIWNQEDNSRIKALLKNKDINRLIFDGYFYCALRIIYGAFRNIKLFIYLILLSTLKKGVNLTKNKIYINYEEIIGGENIFLPHLIIDKKTIIKISINKLINLIKEQIVEYYYSIEAIIQFKSYPSKVKINSIADILNRHHLLYWKIARNSIKKKEIVMDYEGMPHENMLIKVCDKRSKIKIRSGVTPYNLSQGLIGLSGVMDLGVDQSGMLNLNSEVKFTSVELCDFFFLNLIKHKIEYYDFKKEKEVVLILSSCNYINALSIDALISTKLLKLIILKPHPNLPSKKLIKIVKLIKKGGFEVSILTELLKEYRYVGLSSTMLMDLLMRGYKVNLLKVDRLERDIYGNKFYAA